MHRTCTRKGRWACYLASFATIPDVAECCGASFRFTRIFSDVLELDFLHGGNSGRADAFWHAGSVGAGSVFFPRKKNSLPAVLVMMMPFQVTMLSQYLVLNRLGMLDRPQAVVLPGIFATFSVFIMYRFFRGIPENVMEAARMDGAGEFQIFLRIGIPLGSPGILSALVFSFLDCFSMLEQPMTFLKTKSLWPLSLFLPEITSQNAGFSLCASLVTILPAMFVFLAGQDYLEQGIAMAGAKE